jgi:DNA-binding NtrC family response regulator
MPISVLVVDDEKLIRWSIAERLRDLGYAVLEAESASTAIAELAEGPDLVLLDQRLPDVHGFELLEKIKAAAPDVPVIMMTAFSSIENAVEAMKRGAHHYLTKPVELEEVQMLVAKTLETSHLRREVKELRAARAAPYGFDDMIGKSAAMLAAKAFLEKIAASPASTVLLVGESGTGKDLAAKVLHYNSSRADKPFMNITCSALTDSLLESELFGYERGAFTDAKQQKKGLLELADGGTVFLDEIGEMSGALQSKVLRFLEEKTFKRVGGTQDIQVDVRVIAATHRDLREAVREGKFREDLFYRLSVLPLTLPALRERNGDIELLVRHWVQQFSEEFRKPVSQVTVAALRALERYGWPGNVRELRNVIERAVLLLEDETLDKDDLQLAPAGPDPATFRLPPQGLNFEAMEQSLVEQALDRAGGNQTRAGALLGMNRDQIRYRIEKFGLERLRRPSNNQLPTVKPDERRARSAGDT